MFTDTSYNYLAIGNSITKHPINEYWWNEIGMAASTEDKDYVHLLAGEIEKSWDERGKEITKSNGQTGDKVSMAVLNYYSWEVPEGERAGAYGLLDPYLSEKLDLVTVQLGENVIDTATFEADFKDLLMHIQEKCPEAKILVISEFWTDEIKDSAKRRAAQECGAVFVDLAEIQGKAEYQAGMGTTVFDKDGGEHRIEHEGVAAHPGDAGMRWIAGKVLETLRRYKLDCPAT